LVAPVLDFIDTEPALPYFRLAQTQALNAVASTGALASLKNDPSATRRLIAVLALRRRLAPEIASFLDDPEPSIRDEAAHAIHDSDSIPEALPALAATLAHPGDHAESLIRRAINANFRLGTPEAAARVAAYTLLPAAPLPMRLEALQALLAWTTPPLLDRVDGWRRYLDTRDSQAISPLLTQPVNQLLDSTENDILEKAVELASLFHIPLDAQRLDTILHNEDAPAGVRVAALENSGSPAAISYAIASPAEKLRIRGAALFTASSPEAALPYLAKTVESSSSIPERQSAFALLGDLKAASALTPWAERLTAGELPSALQLDVLEAAAKAGVTTTLPRPPSDPLAQWAECLEGGDPDRGEDIFRNNISAQCVACHKFDDSKGGSVIGPNLKSVGLKERRYLLEALALPQASIAKGYGSITLTLTDGTVTGGQLRGESAKGVELRDPAEHGSRVIPLKQIRERGPVVSLMPPMALLLPKRDVRDLVAYLSTLRAK
jgi:putative heme-binding domain-containing protein